jgi:hypothetical protein
MENQLTRSNLNLDLIYLSLKHLQREEVIFQVMIIFKSPSSKILSVNVLNNNYLKFDGEPEFVFTIDSQLAQATAVFLGDKYQKVSLIKYGYVIMIP